MFEYLGAVWHDNWRQPLNSAGVEYEESERSLYAWPVSHCLRIHMSSEEIFIKSFIPLFCADAFCVLHRGHILRVGVVQVSRLKDAFFG
ncbi:hypothetical protein AVEN_24628-1 [Araneus ventricosus]|uniref:Uncharacterized protein n=1 Tax=Araneus ventricosus TaxID=182803 RepID=A0A4Y2WZS1_ARAVE|nr:hypothetical protein AVEN_51410-1 [Araneus ventricosus]GBO42050.1 hypothetical protein AVEN_24628-1 [Araneus ventricosus]